MINVLLRGLMALAAIVFVNSANAFPTATLSFSDPTGTVGQTDTVQVWLDLTVDANGPALYFNPNAGYPFGLDASDIQDETSYIDGNGDVKQARITDFTGANMGMWFGCSGNFTNGCDGGAYTFDWAGDFNSLFASDGTLTIQPGTTAHILFGSFVPTNGSVAPGTYTFYRATLGLSVYGTGVDASGAPAVDENGNPVSLAVYTFPYETCSDGDPSCAFTRTVVAVPEPGTYALMLGGLGLVVFAGRRRQYRTLA